MFLVIGEKPSVAQALAKVLKAEKKEDGYLVGEGCLVSWCFGHLAEYASPESYDERYAKWDFKCTAKYFSFLKSLIRSSRSASMARVGVCTLPTASFLKYFVV